MWLIGASGSHYVGASESRASYCLRATSTYRLAERRILTVIHIVVRTVGKSEVSRNRVQDS